jgi:2'-5' RNA ligase
MRCFLAVPVGEPALSGVRQLLEHCRVTIPSVRWIDGSSPHLTIHFFGAISEADAEQVLSVIGPAVRDVPAFHVSLDAAGAFPNARAARVLWLAPAHPAQELLELASRCRDALSQIGLAVEDRPYRPHCTLGRPRPPWSGDAAQTWNAIAVAPGRGGGGATPLSFTARELVLYESITAAAGAKHLPRNVLPLAASGAV